MLGRLLMMLSRSAAVPIESCLIMFYVSVLDKIWVFITFCCFMRYPKPYSMQV